MTKDTTISKLINYYLNLEEEAVKKAIQKEYQKKLYELLPSELELINSTFLLTSPLNPAIQIHTGFINSLILNFISVTIPETIKTLLLDKLKIEDETILIEYYSNSSVKDFMQILEALHIFYLNSEFSVIDGYLKRKKSKHHLKENGAVYTLEKIAHDIVEKTIDMAVTDGQPIETLKCLDFACGTGRFYFESLKILTDNYGLSIEQAICHNLHAIDIDQVAINILRTKVILTLPVVTIENIEFVFKNILVKNGLIPSTTLLLESKDGIDIVNDFPIIFQNGGFDAIFSNPPYYLLKLNRKDNQPQLTPYYTSLQKKLNSELRFFKNSGIYHYSIEGMLNYYQLAIEMILNLTRNNGQIGIICPSTLFADLTSSKLRKHLLNFHKIHSIRFYTESASLFDNVSQSTVIFFMQKKATTENISIEIENEAFVINKTLIKKSFPINNEIPPIDELGWKILNKLSKFKKIKDFSFIRNKRGELDLTLFKSHITFKNTGWRLVRGNMISNEQIIDKNFEYVEVEDFLKKKSKDYITYDYNKRRLICQQISNIDSPIRLKFTFCEPTDILGNSCNYIVSTRNENDLLKLSYFLNSKLLNWRFKVSSSNNHINNYEIDELPIVNLDIVDETDFNKNRDLTVCRLYGLTTEETNYILKKNKKTTINYVHEEVI